MQHQASPKSPAKRVTFEQDHASKLPPPPRPLPLERSSSPSRLPSAFAHVKAASSPRKRGHVARPVAGGSGVNKAQPRQSEVDIEGHNVLSEPKRPLKRARFAEEQYEGKGKGRAQEILELLDDDEEEEVELNNNEVQVGSGALPSTPLPPPSLPPPIVGFPNEEEVKLASVLAIVPDVSPDYVLLLLRDPQTSGQVAHVLDVLFSAEYPKVVAASKKGKGKEKEVLPVNGRTDWLDLKSRKRLGSDYEMAAYVCIFCRWIC